MSQTPDWNQILLPVLLNTVYEAVTIVDSDGIVRHWNDAAEQLYGIPADDIVGKSILDFSWKSLMVERVLQDGVAIEHAYHEPRPGVHVLINTSPLVVSGQTVGAVSVEQDVTSIVRLGQELMQTNSLRAIPRSESDNQQNNPNPWAAVWGHSPVLREAVHTASRAAGTDATVLITGESGVGKELFAHAIHKMSSRADGRFIAINCGAIPKHLFESELFGYNPGAFTGADRKGRQGKLELARGGTLFLDEIGELPLDLQVKLLRVLEEGTYYPVGSDTPVEANVRVLAATNQELQHLIEKNEFRRDLFYRLNVVQIGVPPLRERLEDIPLLTQRYLQEFSLKFNRPIPELNPEVTITLMRYDWPGNVRQLRNTIQRLVILSEEGHVHVHHLPHELRQDSAWQGLGTWDSQSNTAEQPAATDVPLGAFRNPAAGGQFFSLQGRHVTREDILQALHRTYGNKTAAAKLLGISRGTLYNYIQRFQIRSE
ncbi:sigma-54-dependent Fis family transcriptional regulator [Alicyclobacillus sp. SO9]|uniref:sigma-54 interaction domain-containing protein n=1 Tax=Alicyclobacillus sp. SO9 TaxID=2665646 RepID=UPI0018E6E2E8|nr:sigma 54-interacting transcriptional regulator [Alicyclobacillus sp. SO9]QQE79075.1 sigma 54-interacting transcriptional regulator [Alicyclobacillus sp. SO9]